MPIYEYTCHACDYTCERLQKHDDPPPVCPPCSKDNDDPPKMIRRISLASFHLKGSGWSFDGYGSG